MTGPTGRPVWLLDVDDTVAVDDTRGWGTAPFRRRFYVGGRDLRLKWSPTLVRRIRALVEAGAVDLRWCTTWCPYAYLLEDAWGFPELPHALNDDDCALSPGRVDAAKCDAASAVLAGRRRLIWTDDSAVPAFGPLRERMTDTGRALLIRPNPRIGLQPADMDRIEAFAATG